MWHHWGCRSAFAELHQVVNDPGGSLFGALFSLFFTLSIPCSWKSTSLDCLRCSMTPVEKFNAICLQQTERSRMVQPLPRFQCLKIRCKKCDAWIIWKELLILANSESRKYIFCFTAEHHGAKAQQQRWWASSLTITAWVEVQASVLVPGCHTTESNVQQFSTATHQSLP